MAEAWGLIDRVADTFDPYLLPRVTRGNHVKLLRSGAEYFPALLAAIAAARRSIHLETYLIADDETGNDVIEALAAAARRGVQVRLMIDGFGGGAFAREVAGRLAATGASVRLYRPDRWWRQRWQMFRRLHRKLSVIDDSVAFVGGINLKSDHTQSDDDGVSLGPRFDFAVRCEGPVVAAIALVMRRLWWAVGAAAHGAMAEPAPRRLRQPSPFPDGIPVSLVLRDNLRFRHRIERSYLRAIRAARHDVLIACAYFVPGRRFRQALVRAAARGVRVRLLLQGMREFLLQQDAQRAMYGQLLAAGVEIHEYRRSFLHAKVAVIDHTWATIGSSNIDPFSLLLAREANVIINDYGFCARLRQSVEQAIVQDSVRISPEQFARRPAWRRARDWLAYGFVRLATMVVARESY